MVSMRQQIRMHNKTSWYVSFVSVPSISIDNGETISRLEISDHGPKCSKNVGKFSALNDQTALPIKLLLIIREFAGERVFFFTSTLIPLFSSLMYIAKSPGV